MSDIYNIIKYPCKLGKNTHKHLFHTLHPTHTLTQQWGITQWFFLYSLPCSTRLISLIQRWRTKCQALSYANPKVSPNILNTTRMNQKYTHHDKTKGFIRCWGRQGWKKQHSKTVTIENVMIVVFKDATMENKFRV